jgi:DUF971 family protein
MPRPVDLEHDTTRRVLTITWEDGPVSALSLGYLRAWCPCAGCQGHGNDNGHDSGIYSWDWLWRISAQSEPKGLKSGVYSQGAFRANG